MHVTFDELVEELARAEEFPTQAVRHCLSNPGQFVPGFLDLLRQYAEDPDLSDERSEALFFIVHILGELEEKRAFGPLMDFLSGDRKRINELIGDAVTATMPQVLISTFDGETDRLYRTIEDPTVDEFVRHGAFLVWTYEVASGRIEREEAEAYLLECFEKLQPRESSDNYVWVGWAESIAYLGLESLRPLIRQASERELLCPILMGFDDFESILGERLAASDPIQFLATERVNPFNDTIGTLSKWYGFSPEYLEAQKRSEEKKNEPLDAALFGEPVINPYRHVGRNDPCPCGSGKKFKHCCLN